MAQTVRCGVIGAGAIGLIHMDGFKKHPNAEVVAVAEVNPQRRQEAAEKHKLSKAVEDGYELIEFAQSDGDYNYLGILEKLIE